MPHMSPMMYIYLFFYMIFMFILIIYMIWFIIISYNLDKNFNYLMKKKFFLKLFW